MPLERVFVTGSSGSGKSTLARQIGERTGLPVHDLDVVARQGGGRGPETSDHVRADAVAKIAASGRWVAEGVHLEWTTPLLDAADVIVVLEHLGSRRSATRVMRRFAAGALAEARSRHGRERFLRFGDYARKVRELVVSLPDARPLPESTMADVLEPRAAKLVRCRSQADIDRFVGTLEPAR